MENLHTTTKPNTSRTPLRDENRRFDWDFAVFLWLACGIIGLFLNTLEFVLLIRKKKFVTHFGLNLLSLSLADTLACLSYCLYSCVMISIYAGFSSANSATFQARAVSQILIFSSITTSFIHIVLIALQRLCAVLFPISYSRKYTLSNCIALLIFAWIIGIVYCVSYIYSSTIGAIACYQIFIVGILLIAIYCVIAYKTGLKHARERSRIQTNQNRRILYHSLGVTLAFIICNFPYAINFLFFSNHRTVRKYFYGLLPIRPLLDPLVYFFLYRAQERNRVAAISSCHIPPSEIRETIQ